MTSQQLEPGRRPRDAAPTRALAVSALMGPVIALAGVLALVSARDELPDRIAVHWGLSGSPDRFLGFTATVLTFGLVTALVPLAFVVLGAFMHRSVRGTVAALTGGVAVFLGGTTFGAALAQRGGDRGGQDLPGWWLVAAVLVAVLVGAALGRWGRSDAAVHPGPRAPMPAGAAHLDVTSTTRLAWVGHAAMPGRGVVAVSGLVVLVLLSFALNSQPWALLVIPAVAVLLLATYAARVVVDQSGLRVTSLGLRWSTIPLDHVDHASVGMVSPLREFGGWGWRLAFDGRRGYVTRTGEALVVHRIGEPDVIITVDGAAEAAAVLNTLAARVS